MADSSEPLLAAAAAVDVPQLRRVLEDAGAGTAELLQAKGPHGRAALSIVATTAKDAATDAAVLEAAQLLLASGADAAAIDDTGATALTWAVHTGRPDVAAALIASVSGASGVDGQEGKADGETEQEEGKEDQGGEEKGDGSCAPTTAVGRYVNHRAARGVTALHYAKDGASAKLLLEAGACPSAVSSEGTTPLHVATTLNHEAVAEALLEHGACIECEAGGMRPVMLAAAHCPFDEPGPTLQRLLALGADPKAASANGYTAMHRAAEAGALANIERLVLAGADTNAATTPAGLTPLHMAASRGHASAVDLLVRFGADVKRRTVPQGVAEAGTALEYAVAYNHSVAVGVLLRNRAEASERGPGGRTPMMLAAAVGSEGAIALLHQAGASCSYDVKDDHGKATLDYAINNGQRETAILLTANGCGYSDAYVYSMRAATVGATLVMLAVVVWALRALWRRLFASSPRAVEEGKESKGGKKAKGKAKKE